VDRDTDTLVVASSGEGLAHGQEKDCPGENIRDQPPSQGRGLKTAGGHTEKITGEVEKARKRLKYWQK